MPYLRYNVSGQSVVTAGVEVTRFLKRLLFLICIQSVSVHRLLRN